MQFKVRRRILLYILLFFRFLLRITPRVFALRLGELLGKTAYSILRKDSRNTRSNLRRAFGKEWTESDIDRVACDVFKNCGKTFFEMITMEYRLDALMKRIYVQNFHVIEEILSRNKGIIAIGGHFGNWELLAAYFAVKYRDSGYQGGVIGRRIRYYKYNELLVKMRLSYGIMTFYRDESMKPVLKLLRKNGIIGVVPDQDVDSIKGIYVDYFGEKAFTPAGPAYLSIISGTPLVPACLVWEDDSYILKVAEPIYPERENSEKEVRRITEAWSNSLESFIRQYPEQWVWFHDRWKTKKK